MLKPVNLSFWIDVSGVPFDTTYVGLIVTTPPKLNCALKAFKREAPRLLSKKARQLDREEILRVLKIFGNNEVIMFTTCFESARWEMYKSEFGIKKEFKSKILGYIYYKLISKQHLFTNFPYYVTTCTESHLEIDRVHSFCKKLALADKVILSFSKATGEENDGVRLADYVAQAMKSNRIKKLKEVKNLHCFQIEHDERMLRKLFD